MTVDQVFIIKKLQNLDEMLVAYSAVTRMPFAICDDESFNDQVWIFTDQDKLKTFAEKYKEEKKLILPVKVQKKDASMFYMNLFAMGINEVVFCDGDQENKIELTKIVRMPDVDALPENRKPILNPQLQLSAAYFLSLMGHRVVVYDQRPQLGGMLRYGIPDYRLPQEKLDRDIEFILSTGIEVHTDTAIGRDIEFSEIENQYDAVYISIGAHNDKKIGIDGENSVGVHAAVQLLRDIGEGRVPDFHGKRVCVIGGGNVSMDATRTALRLGAASVTCVYRRRISDMTALNEEIEDAQAEGCQILQLQAPDHIEADENGHVTALWTRPQVIGPYGSDGRPRPYDADAPLLRTPCDIVIVAIGQAIDARPFAQVMPLERGKIKASSDAFVPNTPHVFAGGDAVTGPATVIRAVAAGKVAAANIDAHLGFHHVIQSDVEIPAPHLTNLPACGRIELHNRPSEECVGNFELVKCGMTEQEVQQETSRCLRCDHFGYGIFKGGRTSKW